MLSTSENSEFTDEAAERRTSVSSSEQQMMSPQSGRQTRSGRPYEGDVEEENGPEDHVKEKRAIFRHLKKYYTGKKHLKASRAALAKYSHRRPAWLEEDVHLMIHKF